MIATAGMYLSGDADTFSFATGSILVVAVAVLGSLTILPAVLVKLGHRVHQSRVPLLSRLGKDMATPASGAGSSAASCAARSSRSCVAGGVLLALAAPALHMKTMVTGADDLSRKDFPVMKTYDKRHRGVPVREPTGVEVVVKAEGRHLPGDDGRDRRARPTRRVQRATSPARSRCASTTTTRSPSVAIPLVGTGTDDASMDALAVVRETSSPTPWAPSPGATADVNGGPAHDQGLQRQHGEPRAAGVRVRPDAWRSSCC